MAASSTSVQIIRLGLVGHVFFMISSLFVMILIQSSWFDVLILVGW